MSRLQRPSWPYLTVLLLEYFFAGWLLSTCNAPWFIWAGTQAVTLHVAWVGFDAVALAVAWIVALVWAAAFTNVWPQSIPWAGISVWAATLALLWVLGVVLVLTLAKTQNLFGTIGLSRTQAFWFLITITWMGLGLGRIVNDLGF